MIFSERLEFKFPDRVREVEFIERRHHGADRTDRNTDSSALPEKVDSETAQFGH
jgi:hypothetical protein